MYFSARTAPLGRSKRPGQLSSTTLLTDSFFLFVLLAMFAWAYFDAPDTDTL